MKATYSATTCSTALRAHDTPSLVSKAILAVVFSTARRFGFSLRSQVSLLDSAVANTAVLRNPESRCPFHCQRQVCRLFCACLLLTLRSFGVGSRRPLHQFPNRVAVRDEWHWTAGVVGPRRGVVDAQMCEDGGQQVVGIERAVLGAFAFRCG